MEWTSLQVGQLSFQSFCIDHQPPLHTTYSLSNTKPADRADLVFTHTRFNSVYVPCLPYASLHEIDSVCTARRALSCISRECSARTTYTKFPNLCRQFRGVRSGVLVSPAAAKHHHRVFCRRSISVF